MTPSASPREGPAAPLPYVESWFLPDAQFPDSDQLPGVKIEGCYRHPVATGDTSDVPLQNDNNDSSIKVC